MAKKARNKQFFFLMSLGPNQLKVFKIMAKSKRMAHAKVQVAAGPEAEILEWCMKGGNYHSPRHQVLRQAMGYR